MKNDSSKIPAVAPLHHRYWVGQGLERYAGGPFADMSGGLITFETESVEQARRIVEQDPFILEDVLDRYWSKSGLPGRSSVEDLTVDRGNVSLSPLIEGPPIQVHASLPAGCGLAGKPNLCRPESRFKNG